MRNFCGELAAKVCEKYNKNGGALNPDGLMGGVYLILFLNTYCDTYCFEAIDVLSQPRWFRHEIKPLAKQSLEFYNDYQKQMKSHLADFYDKYAEINLTIGEAFDKPIESLKDKIAAFLKKNNVDFVKDKTRVVVATMLAYFATDYMNMIVKNGQQMNPIITQVTWVSHEKLAKWLGKACDCMRIPESISDDIHIYDAWIKIKNKWYDPAFISSLMFQSEGEDAEEIQRVIKLNKC